MEEYAVLDYLSQRDELREQTLRSAIKCSRRTLDRLVAKKWVTRKDVSAARDASRTVSIAVLHKPAVSAGGKQRKLNSKQRQVLEALAANEGRLAVEHLRSLGVPRSTIESLKTRGLIQIIEEQAAFHVSSLKPRPTVLDARFTDPQREALEQDSRSRTRAGNFRSRCFMESPAPARPPSYLSAMQSLLKQAAARFCSSPRSVLHPASPPIFTDLWRPGCHPALLPH